MVFPTIRIAPPIDKIYQRLGYRRDITRITPQQEKLVERYIDEALALIHLQGTMIRLPIINREKGVLILGGNLRLVSRNLETFLRDCDEALIMGSTAGEAIMAGIRNNMATDDASRAVVFDATASEMADGALDWLMDYLRRDLIREGKLLLKRRYSAGYGDFALENQRILYTLLNMREIGVQITQECLLIPEKSVTAVTGIRQIEIA
ncbi:MAG: hypothetical protein JW902_03725 [Syntrophaceae bacterium]|nr:hypothetical protein [Syntrophaceae bacterium]